MNRVAGIAIASALLTLSLIGSGATQTVHPVVINYTCVKNAAGVYQLTCLNCPAPYPVCNSPADAQQFTMACDNCCAGLMASEPLTAVNPNKIFTCSDGSEHTFGDNTPARKICPPNLNEGGTAPNANSPITWHQGAAGKAAGGPLHEHHVSQRAPEDEGLWPADVQAIAMRFLREGCTSFVDPVYRDTFSAWQMQVAK
jgi:hypothetical protein